MVCRHRHNKVSFKHCPQNYNLILVLFDPSLKECDTWEQDLCWRERVCWTCSECEKSHTWRRESCFQVSKRRSFGVSSLLAALLLQVFSIWLLLIIDGGFQKEWDLKCWNNEFLHFKCFLSHTIDNIEETNCCTFIHETQNSFFWPIVLLEAHSDSLLKGSAC